MKSGRSVTKRLIEIGPAFEARAVAPLEQRFATAGFGAAAIQTTIATSAKRDTRRTDEYVRIVFMASCRMKANPRSPGIIVRRCDDTAAEKRDEFLIGQKPGRISTRRCADCDEVTSALRSWPGS